MLDAGAKVAFGTDWSVAPLNPMLGLDAAVHRRTLDGKHPEGWFPEQRITVREAIARCCANDSLLRRSAAWSVQAARPVHSCTGSIRSSECVGDSWEMHWWCPDGAWLVPRFAG